MTDTPIETVKEMLECVLENTQDPERKYRLRTALQLMYVIEQQHDQATAALAEAELGPDLRENLRDLGYLE